MQHGNQRAHALGYFGYLFYVAPLEDGLETPDSHTNDAVPVVKTPTSKKL